MAQKGYKLQRFLSIIFFGVLILSCQIAHNPPNEFLHANGKMIVDGTGENFVLRGLGPGGWMLQEGYMFHTKVGTQFEIRNMLEELTDKSTTDAFYEQWLQHFFTHDDVRLTKQWGFNAIRLPIHYNLFTPAIEKEPVKGEITWIEKGFTMLDSLVAWCEQNQIYLIIDLHAAPGGQGKNVSISDYDASKPSLWESEENQAKTVALWQKIAQRYKDEPYVGGYDLLNETNWAFPNDGTHPNGCDCTTNEPLLLLYQRIIDAIRQVDTNHIVFVEGNCWANNFNGLTSLAAYDKNSVFSFHKYWNENDDPSIATFLQLRDSLNVPLFLGETGENSNTWFSTMVQLMERHTIGWSTWAYKQMDNDDPYTILCPEWRVISNYNPTTNENRPTEAQARIAMDAMLESIKTKNCKLNEGVIHAYLKTPFNMEGKPFAEHTIPGIISASDYDIGALNSTWYDVDYETVHSKNTVANRGSVYRNDGVDIIPCTDEEGNGYCVSHTENGEWMKYTIHNVKPGMYKIIVRVQGAEGSFEIQINDQKMSASIHSQTNEMGNEAWQNVSFENVQLTNAVSEFTLHILKGGCNFNTIQFEFEGSGEHAEM